MSGFNQVTVRAEGDIMTSPLCKKPQGDIPVVYY
jgi:hypothetical protein